MSILHLTGSLCTIPSSIIGKTSISNRSSMSPRMLRVSVIGTSASNEHFWRGNQQLSCWLDTFSICIRTSRFLDEAQAQKSILPCTPLAVIKILEYLHIYNTILPYGNRLFGRSVCVVNRSEVVGRPLAALLANDGACVYSVDVTGVQQFTRGEGIRERKHVVMDKEGWCLADCVPLCDVVIAGVPGDKYKFPCGLLKEGAVCINFSSGKVSSFLFVMFRMKTRLGP